MAETGYNWAATSELYSAADTADGNDATTDAQSLDGKAACEVGLTITVASGTVDAALDIFVLGTVDGTNYETMTAGSPWSFQVLPVSGATVYKRFPVSPSQYSSFKVGISNETNVTVNLTVDVFTATIPAAS